MTTNYIISALVIIGFIYFMVNMFKSDKKDKEELDKSLEDESNFSVDNVIEIEKNNFRDFAYEKGENAITEDSLELTEYIETYGGKLYRPTLSEEEDLLNSSFWKYYSNINIVGFYKISDTRIITLLETTETLFTKPVSKDGDTTTYEADTLIQAAITVKSKNGELNLTDKLFVEKLKANPEIDILKKSNNYYFKFKRQITKVDLNLFLGR